MAGDAMFAILNPWERERAKERGSKATRERGTQKRAKREIEGVRADEACAARGRESTGDKRERGDEETEGF